MTEFFNDSPIETPADDKYGFDPFAKALATSFLKMNAPIGAAIALNGRWGSGKSSAVNLIRYHLKKAEGGADLAVIDFKCWWFRGEEALTLAFLQELNRAIERTLGDKAKGMVAKIGKGLLQAAPTIGKVISMAGGGVIGDIVTSAADFGKQYFSEEEGVEEVFQRLAAVLAAESRRFLVIIDDIDRLTPDEALLIFKLTKSVGRLPNVMYLLVFDRELAEKSVRERYPSEGPHFLEKIIQASFELPLPRRDDLNNSILVQIEKTCGQPPERQMVYFMNLFYDSVSPFVVTPRDVARLSNAVGVSWPPVAGEVNIADFVALEVMRIVEPRVHNALRSRRESVCGVRSLTDRDDNHGRVLESLLVLASERNRDAIKTTLQRLFPRFEEIAYSTDFLREWDTERRVCAERTFDTYFRMSLSDDSMPRADIERFIAKCGDERFVKRQFRDALKVVRKDGKSRVPVLFEELLIHARAVPDSAVPSLIKAIFEVADAIDREGDRDRGFMGMANNHLRIHWLIRRLTFERRSLAERTAVFMSACRSAALGWLVDFASSAISDHHPRRKENNPEPPEKCLVEEAALPELRSLALKALRSAAADGSLLKHRHLPSLLYRWRDFAEDDGVQVQAWTTQQLQDDRSVAVLAKAFTGESWSQGMGFAGLGDRVSVRKIEAAVRGLDSIMDVAQFRELLETISRERRLKGRTLEHVKTFLAAWEKSERAERE